MITYGEHAKKLIDNGYYVIPIVSRDKRPAIKDWTNPENYNPDPDKYKNCGIGIICGYGENPVYGIDIDVYDKPISDSISLSAPCRIGKQPKALYVFRGPTAGVHKRQSAEYECGKIEAIGAGNQFVAFGIHPDVKRPYSWPEKSILDIPAKDLPLLPDVQEIFSRYESLCDMLGVPRKERAPSSQDTAFDRGFEPGDPFLQKPPLEGVSVEGIEELLANINPDCGREEWRNVGFALHHQFDGGDQGLELWDSWSAKGAKYEDGECETQWQSFGRGTGEPITLAYLIKLGRKNSVEVADIPERNAKADFFERDWSPSRFSSDPPPMKTIIDGILPLGIVGLIYSDGGAGKSTFILDLSMRIALAAEYPVLFGDKVISGGSAVILTAEDPEDVLNRRYVGIARGVAEEMDRPFEDVRESVEKGLRIVSTFGTQSSLFVMKDDRLHPTKFFGGFLEYLKALPELKFIVIDTRTRFSPAGDGDNVIASSEISMYEMLAKVTSATIMILHHTNKANRGEKPSDGRQAFRGPSALYDNTRTSWFLRPLTLEELTEEGIDPDNSDDYVRLIFAKNNYMRKSRDMIIKRDGYKYSITMAASKMSIEQKTETQRQGVLTALVAHMQEDSGKEYRQSELFDWGLAENYGRRRIQTAIAAAVGEGLLQEHIEGRSRLYSLTAEGCVYQLTI